MSHGSLRMDAVYGWLIFLTSLFGYWLNLSLLRGHGTSSDYVRELIRKDQDRLQMRAMLLEGAQSRPGRPATPAYFEGLRDRVRKLASARARA